MSDREYLERLTVVGNKWRNYEFPFKKGQIIIAIFIEVQKNHPDVYVELADNWEDQKRFWIDCIKYGYRKNYDDKVVHFPPHRIAHIECQEIKEVSYELEGEDKIYKFLDENGDDLPLWDRLLEGCVAENRDFYKGE